MIDTCTEYQKSSALQLRVRKRKLIVLWETVYLDRTVTTQNKDGKATDPELLRFLSPLGWEHLTPTGDCTWPYANRIKPGNYGPLRRSIKPKRRILHFSYTIPPPLCGGKNSLHDLVTVEIT